MLFLSPIKWAQDSGNDGLVAINIALLTSFVVRFRSQAMLPWRQFSIAVRSTSIASAAACCF